MKKLIAALLVSMLLFMQLGTCAFAQDADCTHVWYPVFTGIVGDSTPTSDGCYGLIGTIWVCGICKAEQVFTEGYGTISHTPGSVAADWHNPGGTHACIQYCTGCGYEIETTYSCDGPPCNVINSLPDEVI